MHDTFETAHDVGLTRKIFDATGVDDPGAFQRMLKAWADVAVAINSLNRSLGQRDAYPFVIAVPVSDKLQFVHLVINGEQ